MTDNNFEALIPSVDDVEFIKVRLRDIPIEEKMTLNRQVYELGLELTFTWGETRTFKCFDNPELTYEEKINSVYDFIISPHKKMRLRDERDHEIMVDMDKVAIFKVHSYIDRGSVDQRYS
jgi:hypothetical protein